MGGVPRGQKMLKGHLPRVIYPQVYFFAKKKNRAHHIGRPEKTATEIGLYLFSSREYSNLKGDYRVDMLGVRYKPVNFGAEKSLGSSHW